MTTQYVTGRILLVDDQPPFAAFLRGQFGDRLDVCTDTNELMRAVNNGQTWDAAFVDFDLAGTNDTPQRTGLTALRLLHRHRPKTRRIVYTTLSENGRSLFAVAAHRWLGAAVILDKGSNEQAIQAAANLRADNPTPRAWQVKLRTSSYIDALFAQPHWLAIWRLWPQYNGSFRVVAKNAPSFVTENAARVFSESASEAADAYSVHFHGKPLLSYGRANATPLVSFIRGNDRFFNAIDLQDVLDLAQPWTTFTST